MSLQVAAKLFHFCEVEQGVSTRCAGDDADQTLPDPLLYRGVRDAENLTHQTATDLDALLCCHSGLNSTNRDV